MTKLSAADAAEIRRAVGHGASLRSQAEKFGVSKSAVHRVVTGASHHRADERAVTIVLEQQDHLLLQSLAFRWGQTASAAGLELLRDAIREVTRDLLTPDEEADAAPDPELRPLEFSPQAIEAIEKERERQRKASEAVPEAAPREPFDADQYGDVPPKGDRH